jgi:hypothetical protein
MEEFEIDAYLTDRGWVARATRLRFDETGVDETLFKADLGFQDETEDAALRRGVRWVLSKGGKVSVVMRRGAPVSSAPYVANGLP